MRHQLVRNTKEMMAHEKDYLLALPQSLKRLDGLAFSIRQIWPRTLIG
jgi:hypothetical protein